jgi:putative tricarboxylic transport membrane protein
MGRADRISSVFWLLFAIFVGIESKRLGLGTLHEPGPGFLFFGASIALGIMSLVILIRAWMSKKTEGTKISIFGGENIPKILLVLISLFLYAFFMETLGFIVVTLLLLIFLLGIIEKKKFGYTIFVSAGVTAIAYLIFEIWLRSQLPRGLLGFFRLLG